MAEKVKIIFAILNFLLTLLWLGLFFYGIIIKDIYLICVFGVVLLSNQIDIVQNKIDDIEKKIK